ncbi:MAG TPA: SDR family oxidoreductase [Solirubrobacteraceae bacterium]|jgi:3alpha(or 20beta)-hydroxysteroid dehydrogenase|nr:SDR family oxidoreductase [Solirubrobacteraceae bacterium]
MSSSARRLEGRVALVSGGARGIGAAHVRALAGEGARVLIGDVLEAEGRALAAELGEEQARFVALDVTDEDAWASAIAAAEQWGLPVTILVNNAGVLDPDPIVALSPERFRRTIDVNLTGHFLGIRAVIPSMRRAGGGVIVNTSSMTSEIAVGHLAHYTASKHAIAGLTKTAALELGEYDIRVNSLHPGMIRTAMTEGAPEQEMAARYPLRRFGTPEEVAQTMLFIVCDATYASGAAFAIDGGILAGIMMGE